jgi:hypothetical protein
MSCAKHYDGHVEPVTQSRITFFDHANWGINSISKSPLQVLGVSIDGRPIGYISNVDLRAAGVQLEAGHCLALYDFAPGSSYSKIYTDTQVVALRSQIENAIARNAIPYYLNSREAAEFQNPRSFQTHLPMVWMYTREKQLGGRSEEQTFLHAPNGKFLVGKELGWTLEWVSPPMEQLSSDILDAQLRSPLPPEILRDSKLQLVRGNLGMENRNKLTNQIDQIFGMIVDDRLLGFINMRDLRVAGIDDASALVEETKLQIGELISQGRIPYYRSPFDASMHASPFSYPDHHQIEWEFSEDLTNKRIYLKTSEGKRIVFANQTWIGTPAQRDASFTRFLQRLTPDTMKEKP